jgi:hypothetical protein
LNLFLLRTIAFALGTSFGMYHLFVAHYKNSISYIERRVISMGHINGILLEMLFRLSYSTRNPLYGHPAVTVIFSIIGLVAIGYSQWFSIQLRKSQNDFAEENKTNEIEMQTVVSIDKAKAKELAEEKKKGEKYALRLEFIWWFIVGFSIASSFIIPLSILLSSEVVPRY